MKPPIAEAIMNATSLNVLRSVLCEALTDIEERLAKLEQAAAPAAPPPPARPGDKPKARANG
jgi:hypothetical protein